MNPKLFIRSSRQFSKGLNLEAVQWVRERGLSVAQAGPDIVDVHEHVLRKWIRGLVADLK